MRKVISMAVLSGVFTATAVEFAVGGMSLRLSDTCGALESLIAADGTERIVPVSEAFTLQLLWS